MHKKLHVLLQPGGHVELKENPWQAIKHELAEETGYQFSQLKLLQPKQRMTGLTNAVLHPYPVVINTHNFDTEGTHKHTDISYAFTTTDDPVGEPDEGESKDLRWFSASELANLDSSQIFENARQISLYVLNTLLESWEEVDPNSFS